MVTIQLVQLSDEEIFVINNDLKDLGLEHRFDTNTSIQRWADEINNSESSQQDHLRPATPEKLLAMFGGIVGIGRITLDTAFGRTTETEAKRFGKFLIKNKKNILLIKNGDDLIDITKLTKAQVTLIKKLDEAIPEPKMLPKEEQYHPDLQGGLFLCDSWGLKPFWVVFGNVKSPKFMKEKIYEDDILNKLYKDKNDYGYLLMPLIKMGVEGMEQITEAHSEAVTMGLREHAGLLLPLMYGTKITVIDGLAEQFKELYGDKIKDKFTQVLDFIQLSCGYAKQDGFHWRNDKQMFTAIGHDPSDRNIARCQVLTALFKALSPLEMAQELSKLSGKPYVSAEFEF